MACNFSLLSWFQNADDSVYAVGMVIDIDGFNMQKLTHYSGPIFQCLIFSFKSLASCYKEQTLTPC